MPTFRSEITALRPYQVGRQLEDVARAHDLDPDEIIKLTANEGPEGPFPGAVEAAASVLAGSNRYPDNDCWELGHRLADQLGVSFENLLFGAGSVALLGEIGTATGAPGTSMIYGWPTFVMYRFVATWSGQRAVEVPLSDDHSMDLDAMRAAIGDSTSVVIVCNPNNPTGTIRPADEIDAFIDSVPESVLVVVDEAYHEFVTDAAYRTQIPAAVERPNVVVLRTFSKIFSLAALRVGYAIGNPATLVELRKAQPPLTVSNVAQAAALASLGNPEELERRRTLNAARRHHLESALKDRGITMVDSHTNFIFFNLGEGASEHVANMTAKGVIIRAMGAEWVRVTIGNESENRRFVDALDAVGV